MAQQVLVVQIQSNNTITLVKQVIRYITRCYEYEIKVNQLKKYLPMFNTNQIHDLNEQCVAYFYLQGQSKTNQIPPNQDNMPQSIPSDNLINFHIRLQQNQKQIQNKSKQFIQSKTQFIQSKTQFHQSKTQFIQSKTQFHQSIKKVNNLSNKQYQILEQNNSLNYSMSKSNQNIIQSNYLNQHNINQLNKLNYNSSHIQVRQFIDQSNKKPSQQSSLSLNNKLLNNSELLPLNLISQKIDTILENQIESLKKHLYIMRRYKKNQILQQRQKLDKFNKKKYSSFFNNNNSPHTYQYDGSLLELKKSKDIKSFIHQIQPNFPRNNSQKDKKSIYKKNNSQNKSLNSTSLDYTIKQDNSSLITNLQKLEDGNPERKLSSQQLTKKVSFSNGNKRQISHLPFIVLKENTKIIQNKKQLSGSTSHRTSLNRSKVSQLSSQTNKFKSFAQIQQQKRLQKTRQKVLQLSEGPSNELLQVDILPPTLNINMNSQPLRKQSKMMQKYLKKLTEQKTRIDKYVQVEGQKSFNFKQLTVPQKYPIQRYYEYDYEQQRQNYGFEITSKMSTKRSSIINETQCK